MENTKQQHRGRKLRLKLRTIADLSRHLSIPVDYLYELKSVLDEKQDPCSLYRSWEKKKKSSGTRLIDSPREKLKWVQKQINARILQHVRVDWTAKGGIRGMQLLDNVRPHVGKPVVAKFDLADFFPNITSGQVYDLFCSLGCAPDVARLLTRLTTFKGRIPQGAPTSTMLAVLVAGYEGGSSFNARLKKLAAQHESLFSTWVDDVTISGPSYLPRLHPTIERIAQQSHFSLNPKKSSSSAASERQVVTGVVVNAKPGVPREERKKLRAILHQCKTRGSKALIEELGPGLKAQLRGKIAHVHYVNPAQGEKLLVVFNSIEWS